MKLETGLECTIVVNNESKKYKPKDYPQWQNNKGLVKLYPKSNNYSIEMVHTMKNVAQNITQTNFIRAFPKCPLHLEWTLNSEVCPLMGKK